MVVRLQNIGFQSFHCFVELFNQLFYNNFLVIISVGVIIEKLFVSTLFAPLNNDYRDNCKRGFIGKSAVRKYHHFVHLCQKFNLATTSSYPSLMNNIHIVVSILKNVLRIVRGGSCC